MFFHCPHARRADSRDTKLVPAGVPGGWVWGFNSARFTYRNKRKLARLQFIAAVMRTLTWLYLRLNGLWEHYFVVGSIISLSGNS